MESDKVEGEVVDTVPATHWFERIEGPLQAASSPGGNNSKKSPPMLFLSHDGQQSSKRNVDILRKALKKKGYIIYEHAGSNFADHHKVDPDILTQIQQSCVLVICVSKAYSVSFNCKKIALLAKEMILKDRRKAPEMLFCMVHGDYTTESHPYRVTGWLWHLLKDSLWSPAWSVAHIYGAADAISGVISLRRRTIYIADREVEAFLKPRPHSAGVLPGVHGSLNSRPNSRSKSDRPGSRSRSQSSPGRGRSGSRSPEGRNTRPQSSGNGNNISNQECDGEIITLDAREGGVRVQGQVPGAGIEVERMKAPMTMRCNSLLLTPKHSSAVLTRLSPRKYSLANQGSIRKYRRGEGGSGCGCGY